jgi:O-antigen/teichoic acid export membrane protein
MVALRFAAAAIVSLGTVSAALVSSDRSLSAVLFAYAFLFFFYPIQPDFVAVGLHRPRIYSTARMLGSACFVVGLFALTRLHLRSWMVPLVYSTSLAVSAIYAYRSLWPALRGAREPMSLPTSVLFRGAIAVVAAQFLQMGQYFTDVIVLSFWKVVPIATIGEYSAVSRLVQTGALPLVALIYSLAPMYVREFEKGDMEEVKKLERRFRICLALVGVLGASVLITLGPWALEKVSGRAMPSAHRLVYIFAIAYFLVALHNSYTGILFYAGATHLYVATYGLGLLTTLVFTALLVPQFGFFGSAWAMVAGMAAILVSSFFFHRGILRTRVASQLVAPVEVG